MIGNVVSILKTIIAMFTYIFILYSVFDRKISKRMRYHITFTVSIILIYLFLSINIEVLGMLLLLEVVYLFLIIKNRSVVDIIYILITMFLETLISNVISDLCKNIEILNKFNKLPIQLLSMLVIVLACIFIHSKISIKMSDEKRSFIYIFLLFGIFASCFPFYIVSDYSDTVNKNLQFAITITSMATLILTFIIVHMYTKQNNENEYYKRELDLKEEIFKLQEKQINDTVESYNNIRIFKHDIRAHLQIIKNLVIHKSMEDLEHYVNNMETELKPNSLSVCSNIYIAGVLNIFLDSLEDKGIDFKIEYDVLEQITIEKIYISSLFYNLMTNAVEAVEPLKGERKIVLKIKKVKSALFIEIYNSVKSSFVLDNIENNITSKEDKENHGIGLYSIQKVVTKYNGTIDYEVNGNMLKTGIILMNSF